MVKPRVRSSEPSNEEIERFGNQAEQGAPAAGPARLKEPKVVGINFRMTKTQQELLRKAAEAEDVSQQKILDRIVWPQLQAKYQDGQL
ncbi:hypothetical protein ACRB8A_19930 (plasmid) [Arthrobacter sp. G.S.26]|uniref:hypothetical protein n=1 Tax=Arthrobacter sp. G.S.26 TaxID=3433706 RepID=UPI003D787AC2